MAKIASKSIIALILNVFFIFIHAKSKFELVGNPAPEDFALLTFEGLKSETSFKDLTRIKREGINSCRPNSFSTVPSGKNVPIKEVRFDPIPFDPTIDLDRDPILFQPHDTRPINQQNKYPTNLFIPANVGSKDFYQSNYPEIEWSGQNGYPTVDLFFQRRNGYPSIQSYYPPTKGGSLPQKVPVPESFNSSPNEFQTQVTNQRPPKPESSPAQSGSILPQSFRPSPIGFQPQEFNQQPSKPNDLSPQDVSGPSFSNVPVISPQNFRPVPNGFKPQGFNQQFYTPSSGPTIPSTAGFPFSNVPVISPQHFWTIPNNFQPQGFNQQYSIPYGFSPSASELQYPNSPVNSPQNARPIPNDFRPQGFNQPSSILNGLSPSASGPQSSNGPVPSPQNFRPVPNEFKPQGFNQQFYPSSNGLSPLSVSGFPFSYAPIISPQNYRPSPNFQPQGFNQQLFSPYWLSPSASELQYSNVPVNSPQNFRPTPNEFRPQGFNQESSISNGLSPQTFPFANVPVVPPQNFRPTPNGFQPQGLNQQWPGSSEQSIQGISGEPLRPSWNLYSNNNGFQPQGQNQQSFASYQPSSQVVSGSSFPPSAPAVPPTPVNVNLIPNNSQTQGPRPQSNNNVLKPNVDSSTDVKDQVIAEHGYQSPSQKDLVKKLAPVLDMIRDLRPVRVLAPSNAGYIWRDEIGPNSAWAVYDISDSDFGKAAAPWTDSRCAGTDEENDHSNYDLVVNKHAQDYLGACLEKVIAF